MGTTLPHTRHGFAAGVLLAACTAVFPLHVDAQRTLGLGAGAHVGALLPQYTFLKAATTDYVRSAELTFTWTGARADHWDARYNHPDQGLSLFYSTLGNAEVLGEELALTYFLRYYYRPRGRLRVYNRVGVGLTYATRHFDPEDDYRHAAIGSHANVHFNLRLGARYRLSPNVHVRAGLSFDHLSNASTRLPNRGLNYATAFVGGSYRIRAGSSEPPAAAPPLRRRSEVSVAGYVGLKLRGGSNTTYLPTALSVGVGRRLSWGFALGVGADLFYNNSVGQALRAKELPYRPRDRFQAGLHLSPRLIYRRTGLSLQPGVYVGLPERVRDAKLYFRVILQREVARHLSVRLAMKSHYHILDFPELGAAYTLPLS